MAAFVRAGEQQSFTAAAKVLGITPSAVSKAVSRLEAELGTRLFLRTSRSVTLTVEGEQFFNHCQPIVNSAEDARATICQQSHVGKLRIALPITLGQQVIAPKLTSWQQQYPNVQLDIELTDRHVDLVAERFDLAIRFNQLTDQNLIAQAIPTASFLTVAAPSYLAKCGLPNGLAALATHKCLGYHNGQHIRAWQFDQQSWHGNWALTSNQGSFLLQHCLQGGGIMQGPDYLLHPYLEQGQLQQVLNQFQSTGPKWWWVYPQSRRQSKPLAAFRRLACLKCGAMAS